MEEWKEYKLKEICQKITDGSHSSPRAQKEGYPMFSVKDMLEYGFDYSNCKYISLEDFLLLKQNDCVPQKGDVLVAKDGSYLKQIFVCRETKEEGILSSIAIFRPNNLVDSYFLCYLLKSPDVFNYISNNCVSGSALPRIVLKDFKEVSLRVPSRETQDKIVSVLKSLDDKIEINRRINENLEQQAQALFKSWFVDFEPFRDQPFVESELGMIPEGWKVGKLSDIADIYMGASPAGSSYNVLGIGDVFYQGRAEFGVRFPQRNMYTTEAKRFAEVNSVLLSVRAPVGDINVAEEKCCIGRGLASIKSKTNHNSFNLYLMKQLKPIFDTYNGEGTVFGCINKKALESLKIIIPDGNVVDKFDSIVFYIDEKIRVIEKQSRALSFLRDTLLPRLMSGELKVQEIEESL